MAGAGKSFVGTQLAQKLRYECIDVDRVIEQVYGKSLQEILESLGDSAFIKKENDILIEQTRDKEKLVISPGGSIVYSEEAMQHLKDTARVIYLEVPFEVIEARVGKKLRGIVGLGKKTLHELYMERVPLYEKWTDIKVSAEGKEASVVVEEILEQLK